MPNSPRSSLRPDFDFRLRAGESLTGSCGLPHQALGSAAANAQHITIAFLNHDESADPRIHGGRGHLLERAFSVIVTAKPSHRSWTFKVWISPGLAHVLRLRSRSRLASSRLRTPRPAWTPLQDTLFKVWISPGLARFARITRITAYPIIRFLTGRDRSEADLKRLAATINPILVVITDSMGNSIPESVFRLLIERRWAEAMHQERVERAAKPIKLYALTMGMILMRAWATVCSDPVPLAPESLNP